MLLELQSYGLINMRCLSIAVIAFLFGGCAGLQPAPEKVYNINLSPGSAISIATDMQAELREDMSKKIDATGVQAFYWNDQGLKPDFDLIDSSYNAR
jgi:hypothetical protein